MTEYVLTFPIGDITNLMFSLVGIFMAHSLYKSPRKRWQCILAWVIINIVWALLSVLFSSILPHVVYERVGIFVGLTGIFVYLYLFPNIPIPQRIFTYFLVDTSMYLCVLLPRTISLFIAPPLGFHPDILFVPVYCIVMGSFIFCFHRYLCNYILKALVSFQKNLTTLAVFAATAYITMLFFVDPWGNFTAKSFSEAILIMGSMGVVLLGYLLSFRTLTGIVNQMELDQLAQTALTQAQLAQKEYQTTMESINQIRQLRHDMTHHFRSIHAMAASGQTEELTEYISNVAQLVPEQNLGGQNFITESFLNHYRSLCGEQGIAFSSKIDYDERKLKDKSRLGILLGNALKNAYEATLAETISNPFITVEGWEQGSQFVFIIQNSYTGNLKEGYHSTKGLDRGFGITGIRGATEGHGGYLEISHTDTVFTLNAVIVADES